LVLLAWLGGEPWGCDNPTSALKHVVVLLLLLLLLLLVVLMRSSKWLRFAHLTHLCLAIGLAIAHKDLLLSHGLSGSKGHTRTGHLALLLLWVSILLHQ